MSVSSIAGAAVSLTKASLNLDIAIETFKMQADAERSIVGLIDASMQAMKQANASNGQLVDTTA